MLWKDLVFRLEHYKDADWDLGDECFTFYKVKGLVDSYEAFFATKPQFAAQNVVELGVFDGGSIAFWFEWLKPRKHVALDIKERSDSDYFHRYVAGRNLDEQIKTYWKTSQADSVRLREIVAIEFDAPLDLVIDDASHHYGPTKTSFEVLFPLLRPGGLFLLEDWAWGHWPEFQRPDHPWASKQDLTHLVFELIESVGTRNSPIASVTAYHGFTVVERSYHTRAQLADFKLEDHISPPSQP